MLFLLCTIFLHETQISKRLCQRRPFYTSRHREYRVGATVVLEHSVVARTRVSRSWRRQTWEQECAFGEGERDPGGRMRTELRCTAGRVASVDHRFYKAVKFAPRGPALALSFLPSFLSTSPVLACAPRISHVVP